VGDFEHKNNCAQFFPPRKMDLREHQRYRTLQDGLLEVFRRFSDFLVGRVVEMAGLRLTVSEFGLTLSPETSLRGSFTCRLKDAGEEGAERVLSTFALLERAFHNHEADSEGSEPSGKNQHTFRQYMQLFYNVSKSAFKPEILDNLSQMEDSIRASIRKTKRLLRAERNQEVRSSSDGVEGPEPEVPTVLEG